MEIFARLVTDYKRKL